MTTDSLASALASTKSYVRSHGLVVKTEKVGFIEIDDTVSKSVVFDYSTSAGLNVTVSERFEPDEP